MPSELPGRAFVQCREFFAELPFRLTICCAEIDSLQRDECLGAFDAAVDYLRDANYHCCRQFAQALGLRIKHIECRSRSDLDKQIGVAPQFFKIAVRPHFLVAIDVGDAFRLTAQCHAYIRLIKQRVDRT